MVVSNLEVTNCDLQFTLFDKVWVLTGELCDKILPPC